MVSTRSAGGDTVLARQKLTEAGEILEHGSKRDLPAADKHLLRFLAASQYYHGGEYQRAKALATKVNGGYLRPGHRELLVQFHKDVEERANPEYSSRIRQAVVHHWANGQSEQAIKLLQDHPYVMERVALAWLRADLCYQSRRWKAAALFYSDAIRFSQGQPWFIFMRAAGVMRLWASDQVDAAREYAEQLLAHQPTALDYVAACAVRMTEMFAGGRTTCEEVSNLFATAQTEFEKFSPEVRGNADIRPFLSHGYAIAAIAANRMRDHARALLLIEQGLAFLPNGPEAERFRSVLANPAEWLDFKTDPFGVVPKEFLEREQEMRRKMGNEIESPSAA